MYRLLFLLPLLPVFLCQTWSSTLPTSIQALKGSCVVIPCTFTYPGPRRPSGNFHLVWYYWAKSSYPQMYNGRGSGSVQNNFKQRTVFVGNLGQGNCSLQINNVMDTDAMHVYPWIDPDTNSHRFYDKTTKIIPTGSPKELLLSNVGAMTEGTAANVSCSAEHTCPSQPPILTWSVSGSKATATHENLGEGKWKTTSVLQFLPSYKYNGESLSCMVAYPNQQQGQKSTIIYVKYPPKKTTVSIVGASRFKEGDTITLKCTCESNPPANIYRWYHSTNRKALPDNTQTITLADIKVGSGPYYCSAQNAVGIGESPPLSMLVEYATKISPESNCTIVASGFTCHCLAEGHPSPKISWRIPPSFQIKSTNRNFTISTVSDENHPMVLSILKGQKESVQNVSCSAANRHGSSSLWLPINIQYVPVILKGGQCTFSDGKTRCSCTAKGNPLPSIKWKFADSALVSDGDLNKTSSTNGENIISILEGGPTVKFMNVSCSASNLHGSVEEYLQLPIEGMHYSMNMIYLVAGAAAAIIACFIIGSVILNKRAKKRKDHRRQQATEMRQASKAETEADRKRNQKHRRSLRLLQSQTTSYVMDRELPTLHHNRKVCPDNDYDYEDDYENMGAHQVVDPDQIYGNM
ncbi:myelin-associated glycoprotein-like isoform X1 [Ambystoma mexicanum]|uniref:myelin-associated glycoprotein-like isoform X1 n=1 Tax=Ambystoma mexicanum TaxID=8296 RepID=UPI0037E736F5